MSADLAGRTAIVTGASRGIGLAIAAALVSEGANVVVTSRTQENADTAAATLGERAVGFAAHVVEEAAAAACVAFTIERFGGIDILVNNAGAAHPGNFESLTDEDWQGDLDVKLFSQIRCTRAALPHLRRSAAPRVININSVYAKYPNPQFFATTVNRAACLNLSKALAQEYGPEKILVNSVNIGFVVTPQWKNIKAMRAPEATEEEFFATLVKDEVPLGRFGTADEVSGVVTFLASDRASYLTGISIDVAGGMGRYV